MIKVNGEKIEVVKFPNGESLIKNEGVLKDIKQSSYMPEMTVEMTVKFESDEDLLHMMFVKKHIDEMNLETVLVIPYLPYSRMDRTEGETVFTLKYICSLINSLNFKKVIIYEPHSDVSVALLDRCKAEDITLGLLEIVKEKLNLSSDDYIFFPDQGAEKRYSKHVKGFKLLTGIKERDFATGWIKKLDVVGEKPNKDFRVVILDDLCSRGGTFMMSASKLKELGAKEIHLVVTHCEDTIFDGDILKTDLIDRVYTTNSILNKKHEKIDVEEII